MEFSIIFIVDYGKLEWQSICLAASIRAFVRDQNFEIIAYCPESRINGLEEITKKSLAVLGVEIRPLCTDSNFSPAYPHGNKILACAEPRESDFCLFMDTDMIFVRSTTLTSIFEPGGFCAAREFNARWDKRPELWNRVYNNNAPNAPRHLSVFSNKVVSAAYYNAGFIGFDDGSISSKNRQRFGEVWRDISYQIDADQEINEKRPFLDQISLPVAVGACGLTPTELSANYNTHIMFEPEAGPSIRVLHYHSNLHGNLLRKSKYLVVLSQLLAHYGISNNFDTLVRMFSEVLDHVGDGYMLEIPVTNGVRIAQVTGNGDGLNVVSVFSEIFSGRPGNLDQIATLPATYGLIDAAQCVFGKDCRIIGHTPIQHDARPEIWFSHDEPMKGGGTERWFWNTRNSWRAADRQDLEELQIPERKKETLQCLLARCI